MAKPKILVVDDEAAIRFAIRDFLEQHGYSVTEAGTCAEAEALYRRDVYDLVTLDYALPDLQPPTPQRLEALAEVFRARGLVTTTGGHP